MFDGFKSEHTYLQPESWLKHAALEFPLSVNEQTGAVLEGARVAACKGLVFKVVPTSKPELRAYMSLGGSLHKFFNNGLHNYNDFSIADVQEAISTLAATYGIRPNAATLRGLEFGVNIELPFNPDRLIKALICHNEKGFAEINIKRVALGTVCSRSEYELKVYNKTKQANSPVKNLLRIELKVKKMRFLAPYGVACLADLTDAGKAKLLGEKLAEVFSEVLIYDNSIDKSQLSPAKRLTLANYKNPKYWQGLTRLERYRNKARFESLIAQHSGTNIKAVVLGLIQQKVAELTAKKPKNCIRFHHFSEPAEAKELYTISQLECRVKTSHTIPTTTVGKNCAKLRTCKSCHSDISNQRKGSVFCSERIKGKKGAKACRNKDSNKRRDFKARIMRAKKENRLLLITYQHEGQSYTDQLSPNELTITKDWLDKVVKVEIKENKKGQKLCENGAKPEQAELQGQQAKAYLKSFTTINNQ